MTPYGRDSVFHHHNKLQGELNKFNTLYAELKPLMEKEENGMAAHGRMARMQISRMHDELIEILTGVIALLGSNKRTYS
jgi:hypothetical protein